MQAKLNYNLEINLTDEERRAVQRTATIIKEITNIIDISDRTDFEVFLAITMTIILMNFLTI